MTTAREQHASDLATVLADPNGPAEDIVIGGTGRRALVVDLPFHECSWEGTVLERKGLTLLAGVILKPDIMQKMTLGTTSYMVESSVVSGAALDLILTRFAS